jgi:hypothetical protein
MRWRGEGPAKNEPGQVSNTLVNALTYCKGQSDAYLLAAEHRQHPGRGGRGQPTTGIFIMGMLPMITIMSHLFDKSV